MSIKLAKKITRTILENYFPEKALIYKVCRDMIINNDSYLHTTGWIESYKKRKPVNEEGYPIPWMNFSVIKILDERLKKDLSLFEYGSGYSTLFFADRVRKVISVEYDKDWYNLLRAQVPENVELIFKEKDYNGKYCRVINSINEKFDVIIIDGRDRVNCLKQSIPSLSHRGVLLLDDSLRKRYQDGIEYALGKGFKELSIEGVQPAGIWNNRTTIFYRENNCLKL